MAKQINTRIQLKYDSLQNWTNSTLILGAGEIAICTLAPFTNEENPAVSSGQHPVLFKVGNGSKKFSELPWSSALAADVHTWAKKTEDEFKTWVNTIVDHPAAPDLTPYLVQNDITTGGANGTIAVRGTDVAVKGLGSAAYTDSTAYATSEQGTKADNAAAAIATYGDIVTHNADEFAPASIDTGVHFVALESGTNNGTIKLTVDGTATDNIAVTGLKDAAYVTVDSLNATAKGYADAVKNKLPTSADYGVLSVGAGTGIEVTGTAQNPIVGVKANTYDAYGSAAAVLGTSGDAATANTVYGAKAAAAAAQSDATIAKTKIETFLGTVTPDGSADIIDTLAEINSYVGEHGEEFAALSGKVTNIENGTTVVPKAEVANVANDLSTELDTEIQGIAEAAAKAYADSLAGNYATAEQGEKADSAVQPGDLAKVATSGAYGDLTGTPTLGALASKDTVAEADIDGTIGVAKISGLGALATKDNITHDLVTDFDAEVAKIKVNNAVNADKATADAAGNNIAKTYATKAEVEALTTDDLDGGTETWYFVCGTATTVVD